MNIIYKIDCINCVLNVGQTKRQLETRINEHKNITKTSSQLFVISKHIIDYNYSFNWNNAYILDHESNFYKRLIS